MTNFKVLTFLSLLFAAGSCDKMEFEAKFKQCLEESKVSEAEIKSFFSRGMPDGEATDPIKCHLMCVMEKEGFFKNGVYNEELALEKLMQVPHLREHKAEIEKAVKKCKNEKGDNKCDTAYKIVACVKKEKEQVAA